MSYSDNEKMFSELYSASSPYLTMGETQLNKIKKSNSILLDHISTHYIFEDEVHMSFNILSKYKNIIFSNLLEIALSEEYYYKPEYLSFDLYGTTDFWYLLLYVNNLYNTIGFNTKTIKVPTNSLIDTLIKLAKKELRMISTLDNPIHIYKHMLKDLNDPSKQILPSDFDDELDDLTDLKDYEEVTNDYLQKEYFRSKAKNLFNGILKNKFTYQLNTGKEYEYVVPREHYSSFYDKLDNYYTNEIAYHPEKEFIEFLHIYKEGLLNVYDSGLYKFKVFTMGDFSIKINGKYVVNYHGNSSPLKNNYTKNLFEEYSYNSDFKRRNLFYWNYTNENFTKLIFDNHFNRNFLRINKDLLPNDNIELFRVEFPITSDKFENNGDFIYFIDYYLPNSVKYHYIELLLTIVKNDNTEIVFNQRGLQDYIVKDKHQLCTDYLIGVRPPNLRNEDIKEIKLSAYIIGNKSSMYYNEENVTSIIDIKRIKVFTINDPFSDGSDYSIELNKNILYNWETEYVKPTEETDMFELFYSYQGGEYRHLPRGWFWIESNEKEEIIPLPLLSIYDENNNKLLRQMFYDDICLNEEYYDFNLLNGKEYRFSFRTYPDNYNELKSNTKIVSERDTRVSIYSMLEDFSQTKLEGTKNFEQYDSTVVLENMSNDRKYLMIEYITKPIDSITNSSKNKIDVTLYSEIFINGIKYFKDYENIEFNYNFEPRLPYSLKDGLMKINHFLPLRNSIYKEICDKSLEDDWILDVRFKQSYELNYLQQNYLVIPSMKGIFGIIMEFINDKSMYILLFNYENNNVDFIKSGLYKVNREFSLKRFTYNQLHKYFYDKFDLISEINIEDFNPREEKYYKIMKRKNLFMLHKDGNIKPYFRIKFGKDEEIYKCGRLGFLLIEIDGLELKMNLWN